ncbi:MAG: ferrous iron transport protein B [Ruminococcus sp.]|nr:ferrous iron transport protein B [Ruminococcus sp.]
MSVTIALAGNPNSGKTTLFNALTGSNQFVGNWPGVTVEKKEGKLKGHKDVTITDLPGIYSLSPYTLEEVIARNYIINENPDVILNIIDGTNLERNLYLTTQLIELGIPVVMAINMIDVVKKKGDVINLKKLSESLGCPVIEISALKGTGVKDAASKAVAVAQSNTKGEIVYSFSPNVEQALDEIESQIYGIDDSKKRFCAIKLFERDDKITDILSSVPDAESVIAKVEKEEDDDAESIITNERYNYISSIIDKCYVKKNKESLTTSDKIDRVVTNRILGLPIFAVIMFAVYWIAMVGVGALLTDFTNDNIFDEGFHLFGIGSSAYEADAEDYASAQQIIDGYDAYKEEKGAEPTGKFTYAVEDEETLETTEETATIKDYKNAVKTVEKIGDEPDPADYGVFVPSVPALAEKGLDAVNAADWLKGLIIDGIIAGVGAVLGFVPQMLVLFLMLAFLEACGYMARIAFVLDRVFRKFGLSGKSFIPMLIGTGCGIPGIMASRTIENERDRRMTIMTTTFIPCGAKVPFIAMIAGAIFSGSAWVATSAYFIGMAAIIISGIMLKKTKMFAGDPAPFVMELPSYHLPTVGNVLRSMWERGWSFIKKAGTIILLSTIFVWFTSRFGFVDGSFGMLEEDQLSASILAKIGSGIAWIFAPLGWGNWQAAVASITGLVAKENIVGTMGILYGGGDQTVWQTLASSFTGITGFSFLVFNLLCAPCFTAMGAIKREMNNGKWTAFAITYQCVFAYAVALCIRQIGAIFSSAVSVNVIGLIVAIAVVIFILYMLFKPYKESSKLQMKVKVKT